MGSNGLLATESTRKETQFDSWQFLKWESFKNGSKHVRHVPEKFHVVL